MILQTSEGLSRTWHKYGCYELSFFHVVNKLTNETFTPPKIGAYHRAFVAKDWVRHDDHYKHYILDMSAMFQYFNIPARVVTKNGTHRLPPNYLCRDNDIEFLLFKRPGHIGHFVVGDGKGNVAWDPMGRSLSVKEGKLIGKRVYRVE